MTMFGYFNDAPIQTPADDRFGINLFAQAIAQSFKDIESPIGVTMAITGPWGSGKSSAVNLIRHHLQDANLEIIDFKCWWFRGEEALTLAFLQELNATLQKSLGKKAKELIPGIGKILLQTGPVVGPAINLATGSLLGTLTSGAMDFAKRFFPKTESVEKLFRRLSKALEDQARRHLVIIDDIDRLTPNDALLIFRLIKSVGRLPNVMYLLAFDRELAEKAVGEIYPSEGPHFLEKIVQASFELPLPTRDDINCAALSQIDALCGSPKDKGELLHFMNIFYDAVSPYLNTPRDLARLSNSIVVSWPAVAKEVDLGNYVALEIMKLFEPSLYNAIRIIKGRLCGVKSQHSQREDTKEEVESLLQLVPEKRRACAKDALMRLFPRLGDMGYSSEFIEQWEAQRLVCTEKHFDTYFRMCVGNETLPASEIEDFIKHANDINYVKHAFKKAIDSIRKNGKSKVPLLFDELRVHASKIDKATFQSLITAIFEIADDIYRDEDRGDSYSNNHLRIHWFIRKLTLDRCNIEERSKIFLMACQNAQVGWLANFTSSAIENHFPRKGEQSEVLEKCLIGKEHIATLRDHTVKTIRAVADADKLISHPRLPYILFRWYEFSEDNGSEVKNWTKCQLKNDASVSILARAFTGESWSQGLGVFGLGDRVAMRNVRASIEGLEKILDVTEFRRRLEEIEKNEMVSPKQKEDIIVFLQAWRDQEKESSKYDSVGD